LVGARVLLIDALEDLVPYTSSEDELFVRVKELAAAGAQVVMTLRPTSREHLRRLRRHLADAKTAALVNWRAPSFDVRVAALSRTARACALRLPPSSIKRAARGARSIPEAAALLHRLAIERAAFGR
jgi:chromosomal replication initiation ATPase DnaA